MKAIKDNFNNLEIREKYLVSVAVIIFMLVMPYQFIWKPFSESVDESAIRVQAKKNQFIKMQQQAKTISQLQGGGTIVSQPGRQFLNNAINTAAKQYGLSSALNIKSDNNDNVRVSFDNVPFDNVINWLDQLITSNGVIVTKLNVDKQPTVGRVNASIYLELP